jgi:hypothetical protein
MQGKMTLRMRFLRSIRARHPNSAVRFFGRSLKRLGISECRFHLSFDCDTDRDMGCVEDVHKRCMDAGVLPAYAVPGDLLLTGRSLYRKLAETGSEFLNHGYRLHSEYVAATGRYRSTLNYGDLTDVEVRKDIRDGHAAVLEATGKCPKGFRTPHFAAYCSARDLGVVHSALTELDYSYSSSTLPEHALLCGPLFTTSWGITEIPVSGSYDRPCVILSSYGFRFSDSCPFGPDDFGHQLRKLAAAYRRAGLPGLINIYADPSQVADWDEFFEAIADLSSWSVPAMHQLAKPTVAAGAPNGL